MGASAVGVEPVVEGTTSSVVTVEPLEDGMGTSVEAADWNVEGITSSIVDALDCSAGWLKAEIKSSSHTMHSSISFGSAVDRRPTRGSIPNRAKYGDCLIPEW